MAPIGLAACNDIRLGKVPKPLMLGDMYADQRQAQKPRLDAVFTMKNRHFTMGKRSKHMGNRSFRSFILSKHYGKVLGGARYNTKIRLAVFQRTKTPCCLISNVLVNVS